MKRYERGITLISLIITIIVLLILAGTAISIAINGENLFSKATTAKETWNNKVGEEKTMLNSVVTMLETAGQPKSGLYDIDTDEMLMSWDELINPANSMLQLSSGTLSRNAFDVASLYGSNKRFKLVVDKSVTNIGTMGGLTQIQELILPNTIVTINGGAFSGWSALVKATVPSGSVGSSAFNSCTNLKELIFGDGVVSLPNTLQGIYGIEKLSIGNGVQTIPDNFVTSQCKYLKELKLGDNIETIGSNAFSNAVDALKELTLPKKIKTIGDRAFAEFRVLESINFPEGLQSIGSQAFEENYKLKKIVLPSSLTELKTRAFVDCESLEEVVIKGGITTIQEGVFSGCPKIEKIVIPASVTAIADQGNSFPYLTDVYYTGTQAQWQNITFAYASTKTALESATMHYNYVIE